MEGLDFSALTDDQLVGLLRSVLRECVSRGDAVQAAARAAGLDEAERARIARDAADREAAKLRAQERERVAREAAEAVRRQREEQEAASRAAEAAERARASVRLAEEREARRRGWLRRFASLVGRRPEHLTLLRVLTGYGWRVLLNEGGENRWDQDHLVDYHTGSAVIHTSRALVKQKKALIALCAEFWAEDEGTEAVYFGSEFDWTEVEEPAHA